MNRIFLVIKPILISTILIGAVSCRQPDRQPEQQKDSFRVPTISYSPKKYIVYKTNSRIAVDGRLNEKDWELATWTDKFVDVQGDGDNNPMFETRAKLLWDDEYLYIGAYLQEEHIWATMTERDDLLYLDNAFEIFIDPDRDTHNYAEFEINALGTIWDLLLTRPYRDDGLRLSDFNLIGFKSNVFLDGNINEPEPIDKGWSLEYAIPISSILAIDGERNQVEDGTQWKVNFQRTHRRLEIINGKYKLEENSDTGEPYRVQFSVWSPQGLRSIHYPEMWGLIQFSKDIVGTGTVTFNDNSGEKHRWALRQLYYQMRDYHMNNGQYPSTIDALNLDSIAVLDGALSLESTSSMFTITHRNEGNIWHINHNGRVWEE